VIRCNRETEAVIKLSAPYRPSRLRFPHEDLEPFVSAVIEAYGIERCVWGSDWPFVNTRYPVDYGKLLQLVARWVPDPADRERLFW
jgi:predicted TIM-barrel fold metal-dependent hydrolase